MGRYHCDYCNSTLTHDSFSVRKNHIHGKQHVRLHTEYYENIIQKYPQFNNKDLALEDNPLIGVFMGIPGQNGGFQEDKKDMNRCSTNFKLKTPKTYVGLPNPPPNAFFKQYGGSNNNKVSYNSANNVSRIMKTTTTRYQGRTGRYTGGGFKTREYGYKGQGQFKNLASGQYNSGQQQHLQYQVPHQQQSQSNQYSYGYGHDNRDRGNHRNYRYQGQ